MVSAERMKEVAKLILDGEQKIVVLSAMSGTTNSMIEISDYLYKKNIDGALDVINILENRYYTVINELFATPAYLKKGEAYVKEQFGFSSLFCNYK